MSDLKISKNGVVVTMKDMGNGTYQEVVAATINGSLANTVSAPITGVKTITATAAEIFAGTSVKANRRRLIIRNEDPILRFRVGSATITQQTGFPVEPGATYIEDFDPTIAVPIYAISEGANLNVAVTEE